LLNENGGPRFDLIHVEHLRGARYGVDLLRQGSDEPAPPIVWDSVDCISLLFRRTATGSKRRLNRWLARFELGRTERYEGQLARQFDHVLLTSPADREAFLTLASDSSAAISPLDISVLANGVDVDYFSPPVESIRDEATVVVTGKMSYHANVTMALFVAEEIMPRVWRRRPEVRLVIAGKDPVREVLALARNPSITVTGSVPDMRPYLQRATIAAVPIAYGAGIQNKILEAMACATPVVTTPQAGTALSAVAGRDYLVAENADGLAEETLCLLSNPDMRRSIGESGRLYVERSHNWNNIAAQLEGIYHDIIIPTH
jgi:glycosyltransferase involved in cell wall biosynthesis